MTTYGSILVVGGSGMLRPAVQQLLRRGDDVAVVARRPHRAGPDENVPGRFIPVVGEWSAPTELTDAVASEMHREITTAIIWVHDPYRRRLPVAHRRRDIGRCPPGSRCRRHGFGRRRGRPLGAATVATEPS